MWYTNGSVPVCGICFIRWKTCQQCEPEATSPQGQNDRQMKGYVLRRQRVWNRLVSYAWVWRITANRQMETVTTLKPLRNPMSQCWRGQAGMEDTRPANHTSEWPTAPTVLLPTAPVSLHWPSGNWDKLHGDNTRPFKQLKNRTLALSNFTIVLKSTIQTI